MPKRQRSESNMHSSMMMVRRTALTFTPSEPGSEMNVGFWAHWPVQQNKPNNDKSGGTQWISVK